MDELNKAIAELIADESDREDLPFRKRKQPEDWTIGVIGPKGGGKTLWLARNVVVALAAGLPTYTNLTMKEDGLNRRGITARPGSLDVEDLLKFDEKLYAAFIGIDEISTWMTSLRAMSTTQIVMVNWFGQTRKDLKKIMWNAQVSKLPPRAVMANTDLLIYAQDYSFTEWGTDHGLDRGFIIALNIKDQSGYFTGRPGMTWGRLYHQADRLRDVFHTGQHQDPYAFARKTTITGGEQILDLDTMKVMKKEEKAAFEREKGLREFKDSITALHNTQTMRFIRDNGPEIGASIEDGVLTFAPLAVEVALAKRKGREVDKQAIKTGLKLILKAADEGQVATREVDTVKLFMPEYFEGALT
ncbi:MAG: hypothetical protein PHV74_06720 [Dehalococcoidia bacterium]|nr:hypothetical protein [Dehalococcoidia bacterium]